MNEGERPPPDEGGPIAGTLEQEGPPDSPETKAAKAAALAGDDATARDDAHGDHGE